MASVAAIIGLLYLIIAKKPGPTTADKKYDVFIGLGFIWLVSGLAGKNPGIWPLGLIFLLAGLAGKLKKK